MLKNFMVLFWEPVLGIWEKVIGLIPHLIAAVFIILIGFFASRVIASAIEHIFRKAKLDNWTSRIGLNEVMARVGLGKSPSMFISALVYWFIMDLCFIRTTPL